MKQILPYFYCFVFASLLSGCSRDSNTPSVEKAEVLYQRAMEEINVSRFVHAERLLTDAIGLFSTTDNSPRLAECYSSLSYIQTQSGKLSAALQSYETLRKLQNTNADRIGEIQTMIEIGEIRHRLGMVNESIVILEEAFLSSQLFRSAKHYTKSAFQLGVVNAGMHRYQKASSYFSMASAQFLKESELNDAIESNAGNINALLRTGNTTAAIQYFSQCENILINNASRVSASRLYTIVGFSFLNNDAWEPAKSCFDKAIARNSWDPRSDEDQFLSSLGIGEVFFNNFAFAEAQQYYIKAYSQAKAHNNIIAQAYLLVRIADCDLRDRSSETVQEKSIRMVQFYEQAQNLFYRAKMPFGEAIVHHRLGLVMQAQSDDNAAVTHFKKAFEKFVSSFQEQMFAESPVDLTRLIRLNGEQSADPVKWFSADLIEVLLEQRKYSDALLFMERSAATAFQQQLYSTGSAFRNSLKDSLFAKWRRSTSEKISSALELQRIKKGADNDYTTIVQQKYNAAVRALQSASSALRDKFPEFRFMAVNSLTGMHIPQFNTVVRYYVTRSGVWVITIQNGKEPDAIRLKGDGLSIVVKMKDYIEIFTSGKMQIQKRKQLSGELYSTLVAPIEKTGQQRFIIIPPEGFEKLPFHSLEKNGRSLIELIEISYLPSLSFVQPKKPLPAIITNIAAFGYSTDSRWGLEFELRDIRSFFRNAQIYINQSATVKNIEQLTGESIQISSRFQTTNDGECILTLSDGTPSLSGVAVPISGFSHLYPFPLVQMYDLQSKQNGITPYHSLLWLLNGSSAVITNELPLNTKTTRKFGEHFYSSFATDFNPYTAYRKAMNEMAQQYPDGLTPESYFYYGL